MGSPGSYRSYKPGGIQKAALLVPPVNGKPTDRRMTFAEAVDQPELFCLHTAAANYKPSETRDINPKRLQNCAAAGLSIAEIMRGFNCSKATAYNKLKKCGIKLNPDSVAQAIQAAEDKIDAKKMAADIMDRVVEPEPVAEDEPEPVGSIEADQLARKDVAEFERRKPGLIVNEDFEAEFVKIDAELAKEPPADEYTLVFGKQDTLPVLIVKADGTVCIKNCEMDMTLRYVVCFRSDFKGVKVADDKCGREFKPDGKRFQFACIDIPRSLTAAGIELPARYRLDIEEMTGVLL